MGGRPVAGGGQMTLALIGCVLIMVWFFQTMKAYYGTMVGDSVAAGNIHFLIAGALFFGASWLWSLLTSISLLREAKTEPPAGPAIVPPVITNPPPKM